MTYGLNISGGNYYGSGSTSTGTLIGRTRSASSANFNTMARNVAAGYSSDIEVIQNYLKEGKTDKAIEMYDSLFEDVKSTTGNYNYDMTDAEIKSILKSAYESTTGTSIVNSIEKNTVNSFWTGFKQAMPIYGLFCNDMSEAEAMAELTGEKVSTKEKVLEGLGWLAGTAVTWLALGPIKAVCSGVTGAAGAVGKALQFCGWIDKFDDVKNVGKLAKAAGVVVDKFDEAAYLAYKGGKLLKGAAGLAGVATVATGAVGFGRVADVIEY